MPAMVAEPVKSMEIADRSIPLTDGATPFRRVLEPLNPTLVSLITVGLRICWKLTRPFCGTAVMCW